MWGFFSSSAKTASFLRCRESDPEFEISRGVQMKADSTVRANGTFQRGWVVVAAALCWAPAATPAADPGGSKPAGQSAAVTLESTPGSPVKRIVLSAKAAERLGIAT